MIVVFAIVFIGWILSVCLHEFGHAIVAYKGGDYTVKEKGYLTFNPIKYAHPFLSIILPLIFLLMGGIGLPGGAVYISEYLLRSNGWRTAVALAGPAMNLLIALVLAALFQIGIIPADGVIPAALAFLTFLQISAVVLNLLPIPSFDGFNAIAPYLNYNIKEKAIRHANMIFLIFFIVMWSVRPVNAAFWKVVIWITLKLGIDPLLIIEGSGKFFFWEK